MVKQHQVHLRDIKVRYLIIILLSVSLSGCFGFSFWFERLDTLTMWRLDTMFELDAEQEELVQPVLVDLKELLRRETVPDLITRLELVDQLWNQGQMQNALLTLETGTQAVIGQFLTSSWPEVAPLLTHLRAENAQAYMDYGEEKIDDWFDQTKSQAAKLEDRIERLEDWFGDLSDQQIELVTQTTHLLAGEREIRIQNSRQRRQRFMTLALSGDMDTLEILYKYPHHTQTPEYQLWRSKQRDQLQRCLYALFPTLSDQQHRHASKHIRDWIEQLKEIPLAGEG